MGWMAALLLISLDRRSKSVETELAMRPFHLCPLIYLDCSDGGGRVDFVHRVTWEMVTYRAESGQ